MAIAFGAISTVSTSQTPTSVAVSGSDTIGIVYVSNNTPSAATTAVTWNGVSMTQIGSALQIPGGSAYLTVWWVANPASSSTISFTGGTAWRSFSMYYTGAKQTGQPDSSNTGTSSSSNTISVSTTVVASNCWLWMCMRDNGSGGVSFTPSNDITTMRANADAGDLAIGDSNGTVATGSRTGTMTGSASVNNAAFVFSIAPAVSGPTNLKSLDTNLKANIKSYNTNLIANVKSIDTNA